MSKNSFQKKEYTCWIMEAGKLSSIINIKTLLTKKIGPKKVYLRICNENLKFYWQSFALGPFLLEASKLFFQQLRNGEDGPDWHVPPKIGSILTKVLLVVSD